MTRYCPRSGEARSRRMRRNVNGATSSPNMAFDPACTVLVSREGQIDQPSVVGLKSDAAVEKPKDRFLRDFWGSLIFDFCNNIGTFETWRPAPTMSVHRGTTDLSD